QDVRYPLGVLVGEAGLGGTTATGRAAPAAVPAAAVPAGTAAEPGDRGARVHDPVAVHVVRTLKPGVGGGRADAIDHRLPAQSERLEQRGHAGHLRRRLRGARERLVLAVVVGREDVLVAAAEDGGPTGSHDVARARVEGAHLATVDGADAQERPRDRRLLTERRRVVARRGDHHDVVVERVLDGGG